MLFRILISLTLVITISLSTLAQTPSELNDDTAAKQAEQLTPEEKREAVQVANYFEARFEQTLDLAPLIDEFFISDFAERLRADDQIEQLFPLSMTQQVAAQATPDEIVWMYVASINGGYLIFRLYDLVEARRKREMALAKTSLPELTIEDIFPRGVIDLIKSDPVLAADFDRDTKSVESANPESELQPGSAETGLESSDGSTEGETFENLLPFKSIKEVRHYTSLFEQALVLLREHSKSIVPEVNVPGEDPSLPEEESVDQDVHPRLSILEGSGVLGYPAGTRIIRVDVSMFVLRLVRTDDGRLKVLQIDWNID